MGLTKDIYNGQHYHCDRKDHLKKEKVSLQSYNDNQREKLYIFKVGNQSRTFKDEEFCFFDLEELEFRIVEPKSKKGLICLAPKISEENLQNFLCLTIVIYKVQDGQTPCMYQGSNRIKLFEKVKPGTKCALRQLGNNLKNKFGSAIKQWFMYSIGGNNNEQPVRVVLRKQNFSILDHQLIVLHYHSLQSLEFQEFLINPCNGIINMSITEASETAGSQQMDQINLRYSLSAGNVAYDFRRQLCDNLHEIHFANQNEMNFNEADPRVVDWILHLRSINSDDSFHFHRYENDTPPCFHDHLDISSNVSPRSNETEKDVESTSNGDSVPSSPPTPHRFPVEDSWETENPPPAPHRNSIKFSTYSSLSIASKHKEATEGTWSWPDGESCVSAKPMCCASKLPKNHLLRAESIMEISKCEWQSNSCNNSDTQKGNNACYDDSDYRTIYYKNLGWIKYNIKRVDMKRRIQRQRHMKAHLPDVDFEVVSKHENWWDNKYKQCDEDEAFQRIYARKILNKPCLSTTDYWNGDLCITVQLMMEKKSPRILPDLDLSWSQLLAVIIHLSVDLHPAFMRKDWRDLAEILGLVVRDIEIIQYFCFTQREWPARVVLCHWKLLKDKGRQVPCFNFYNLRLMMQEIGRNDILKIVDYSDTNCYEDNDDNFCTHL